MRATRTARSGGSPASPPSGRSADSERPSARSATASPVAPRRLPRSQMRFQKQPESQSARRRRSRSRSPGQHWWFAQRCTQSSRQEHSEMLLIRAVEHRTQSTERACGVRLAFIYVCTGTVSRCIGCVHPNN